MNIFQFDDIPAKVLTATVTGAVIAGGVVWSMVKPPGPLRMQDTDYVNQSVVVDEENFVRSSQFTTELDVPCEKSERIETLYDIFQCGLKNGEFEPCLEYKSNDSDAGYCCLTYSEVNANSIKTGSGIIRRLNQAPGQNTRIGIFMKNCVEWIYVEQACTRYSMLLVPLYDTLGEEACNFILNHVQCEVIFVDTKKKVEFLIKSKPELQNLKYIVTVGELEKELVEAGIKQGLDFLTLAELMEIGARNPVPLMLPKSTDTSTILFTSGTTGIPKGCVITHGSMVSSIVSAMRFTDVVKFGKKKEVHLSFLPLTHVYERLVHALMFTCSGKIVFFSGDIRNLGDEMKIIKPTILFAVPRILSRVYDKVTSTINKSPLTKYIYDTAFSSKMKEVEKGIIRRNSIWDYVLFRKIQAFLGGNIEIMIVGSAPVPADVLNFFRAVMACLVLEGYGQTETTGPVTMTLPGDNEPGNVGVPVPGVLVKMCDVPELDLVVSRDHKGEICVKGKACIKEYFHDPEMSKQLIDSEGWLHTGDIGLWTKKGQLKIIDRCKHIFKLSQGEYLAPERLENIFSLSRLVAQIFVTGDSLKDFCVAIVIPDVDAWRDIDERFDSIQAICTDKEAADILLKDLQSIGKQHRLFGFEIVRKVCLSQTVMTVENDLLTPTLKLKRKEATKCFAKEIEALYK